MSALTKKRSTLPYAAVMAISVCLPARNEGSTVASIVREALACDIVDEVVVIDDGSTDDTAAVASAAGARVLAESALLPEAGPGSGKGNALWKSLVACTGDIICFLDADLRNFRAEYVERLCTPLLTDPDTLLVKADYIRAFEGAPTGGGRVTELVARPLLSLLFPKLADIAQPLGGEYAARRRALEVLPFVEGWGVELGLLIDIVERFGRDAVAQVDLGVREHRNRPLEELSPQALEVIATALQRAAVLEAVEVRERPPIITYPAYRAQFDPPR
jgi:glucosyl-3-phosphoglycerate synthase